MKQIGSNVMANKLAEGFLHRYKRPYGKSLLDAYIHTACYRKIYKSYRYQSLKRSKHINYSQYQTPMTSQSSVISPHETRSQMNLNESNQLPDDSTIPFATTDPNIELSARSCLFRPCLQRVSRHHQSHLPTFLLFSF